MRRQPVSDSALDELNDLLLLWVFSLWVDIHHLTITTHGERRIGGPESQTSLVSHWNFLDKDQVWRHKDVRQDLRGLDYPVSQTNSQICLQLNSPTSGL